ncbi:diacylglycerol kinase [Candidatus Berkiella aquae]|uniref:Diacylglycerol kinase n=1 Tax=Candidatus Berkiella aquae TaxID=295108 RepID=A0A0Q9YW09_9GAMM|nr:diacylglycerol kinase [Candidatus Berkiella aquae]MCS5710601.1 diacylglycerol kinase [Candidatus Berkiella aquae]
MNIITFHVVRLVKALGYSLQGLFEATRSEPAFTLEVILFIFLLPIALLLKLTLLTKALLIGSLLLVLIVELLNSAIEATVDHISLERHPLAKKAKDMGSAAVLLCMLNAALIWCFALL